MDFFSNPVEWILGFILILSAIGVLAAEKPVHASLSFLLTLLTLATLYLQLSASFIAIMQVLVYAGAILVLFMFVIILFQDAHEQLVHYKPQSIRLLILTGVFTLVFGIASLGIELLSMETKTPQLADSYGTVQALGKALYLDFFIPFEAITMLFLVAAVGALYIGKRGKAP